MEDSLKVARGVVSSISIETVSSKIELNLGKNEVAIISSLHRYRNVGVAAKNIMHGLYRRNSAIASDIIDPEAVARDKNWLMWELFDTGVAGYLGPTMDNAMYYFSDNLVLIRSPLTVLRNTAANYALAVDTLYYKTKIVSDKEFARFLMKYHS